MRPSHLDLVLPPVQVRRVLFALAILPALVAGCRDRDSRADLPEIEIAPSALRRELDSDDKIADLTDASLDAYRRATRALLAAGDDCAAATRSLRDIVEKEGATIAKAKLLTELPDLAERARPILEARAEATADLTDRFDAAMLRCGGDPRLRKVLAHF